jgi:hypothetical protein
MHGASWWHPLQLIPAGTPRCAALVVTAFFFGALGTRSGAPNLCFACLELARTRQHAEMIIGQWQAHDLIDVARRCVQYDNWFLLAYSTGLALLVLAAAERLPPASMLAQLGPPIAWAQWLAAACDRVENAGLTAMLAGQTQGRWPFVTFCFAATKFALILVGLAYLILFLVALAVPSR